MPVHGGPGSAVRLGEPADRCSVFGSPSICMATKHICVECGGPATKSVALTNYDPENMFEGYVMWYCDEHYSDPKFREEWDRLGWLYEY